MERELKPVKKLNFWAAATGAVNAGRLTCVVAIADAMIAGSDPAAGGESCELTGFMREWRMKSCI
jgi:hypothetical protein